MGLRRREYLGEALQIRPGKYRGKEGFKLRGKSPQGKSIAIFVRKRETAEKLRDAFKRGASSDEIGKLITGEGK